MPLRLGALVVLGLFAMLMIYVGPIISGVKDGAVAAEHQSHTEHLKHVDHGSHALMGHLQNPALPDWVNQLSMCGYCELLAFSPALAVLLILVLVLLAQGIAPVARQKRLIYINILLYYASPRAPPFPR